MGTCMCDRLFHRGQSARNHRGTAKPYSAFPRPNVQATPDLLMGDLLKNMRSSQIFSVCGLPDIKASRVSGSAGVPPASSGVSPDEHWQVELQGLDVFDPITMEVHHRLGTDV